MTIYAINEILSSKSHNPHYLNRYIWFIEYCQKANKDYVGYTEKHHICPQAKDLFSEYKSFSKHPWNKVVLTPRQHFIAHHLLWKAYPEMKSMQRAFFLMCHKNDNKLDSRTYAILSEEYSKNSSESALKRVADKTHHLLGGDIQKASNRKRVADKTHHLLGGEIQRESTRKKVADKSHNFLGGEIQKKRVADKTHHLLGGEIQRETQIKRVKDGIHPFLGGEMQRQTQLKRSAEGIHHMLSSVGCINREGEYVLISKEIYHKQTGPKETHEYVHFNTKEAKRRKAKVVS